MIHIVDYGAGNLRSVENTLSAIGVDYKVVTEGAQLEGAKKVILPGVGHYGQIMRSLTSSALRAGLLDLIDRGVPLLGICIGLQCFFEGSEEEPGIPGFGLFKGVIRRFEGALRVPHMGWDQIIAPRPCTLLRGISNQPFVYFAHSYYAPLVEATRAECQ
ncbi:MAG: imidazole glycerol phosphate synthase subunit HisH, partial [Bryobacterales bacterium]|nr:imidazole glycerol phosphate synthase subunit HisH [Bryobacterales bacterium]